MLEKIVCNDFLGIDYVLTDIDIPSEGFEMLLRITKLVGINKNIINIIKNNIPRNYDLKNLGDNITKKIIEYDEYKIISGSHDGSIKIWDSVTGELIKTLYEGPSCIYSVCISQDNKLIISTGTSNNNIYEIRIHDVDTNTIIHKLIGHQDYILCARISADGKRIVSASRDTSIKIWNVETGELINTLRAHTNYVRFVSISSDDKLIVSASADNTIKIWKMETGELINTLRGHEQYVRCVCISRIVNELFQEAGIIV